MEKSQNLSKEYKDSPHNIYRRYQLPSSDDCSIMLASTGNILQGNNHGIVIFNANNSDFIIIIVFK